MTRRQLAVTLMALSVLAGCVAVHPYVDATAGDTVVASRARQTLNPQGTNVDVVPGIDGRPAKESMDRYVDSFKTPPPTLNVINIGGSLSQDSGNQR